MIQAKVRRVRDPIYDIYRFDKLDKIDNLAIRLIDTPAFQRLRRIKQLGFSDYVYPGASHTRFAHSLGVFVTARRLVDVIKRQGERLDSRQEKITLLAALLHDIGHGPFSHAFEAAEHRRGGKKQHEEWSADIIRSHEGGVAPILGDLAEPIAQLVRSDEAGEIYSAIVSSSFDADRLDYIQRDRAMSGTGSGAIDFEWLLEHVHLQNVDLGGSQVRTFTLDEKAIQQAEIFLLARYHLYDQVYLHKTTRGFECVLTECLSRLSHYVSYNRSHWLGLPSNNLLVQFLGDSTVESYLRIDDTVVMAALQQIAACELPINGARPNEDEREGILYVRDLARRIVNRAKPCCLELERIAKEFAQDYGFTREAALRLVGASEAVQPRDGIFFDEPKLTIYGHQPAGGIRDHKRLWIRSEHGAPREITSMSTVIREHAPTRPVGRLYFLSDADRKSTLSKLRRLLRSRPSRRSLRPPERSSL